MGLNEDIDFIKPRVLERFPSQSIPSHIVALHFNANEDSDLFRYWWKFEGYLLFKQYVKDMNYEPVQEDV